MSPVVAQVTGTQWEAERDTCCTRCPQLGVCRGEAKNTVCHGSTVRKTHQEAFSGEAYQGDGHILPLGALALTIWAGTSATRWSNEGQALWNGSHHPCKASLETAVTSIYLCWALLHLSGEVRAWKIRAGPYQAPQLSSMSPDPFLHN